MYYCTLAHKIGNSVFINTFSQQRITTLTVTVTPIAWFLWFVTLYLVLMHAAHNGTNVAIGFICYLALFSYTNNLLQYLPQLNYFYFLKKPKKKKKEEVFFLQVFSLILIIYLCSLVFGNQSLLVGRGEMCLETQIILVS